MYPDCLPLEQGSSRRVEVIIKFVEADTYKQIHDKDQDEAGNKGGSGGIANPLSTSVTMEPKVTTYNRDTATEEEALDNASQQVKSSDVLTGNLKELMSSDMQYVVTLGKSPDDSHKISHQCEDGN